MQPRVGATLAVDDGARLVARASAGVVADPLYATHVDRTVGGETPVVTYQILPDGRRVELDRTTPTVAGVAGGIRHPQVRELSAGADFRLAGAVQVGGTIFARRFLDTIDTVYPDARWLALARPGLDGGPVTIYRWLNRRAGDAPTIVNVDGTTLRAADGQTLGVAAAGRDYAGVIGHVALTLPRDRGSVVVAITSARSRGTHRRHPRRRHRAQRSLRVADGGAGQRRRPVGTDARARDHRVRHHPPAAPAGARQRHLPAAIGIALRRACGRSRAATLERPVRRRRPDRAPRAARHRAGSSRSTSSALRLASTLPFGRRRPLEIYADVYNVLRRHTVTRG